MTFYLPVWASRPTDIAVMAKILEKYVPKGSRGLKVIGSAEDFTTQEGLETVRENMKPYVDSFKIAIHGFSGLAVYTEGLADLTKEAGKNLLDTYIKLGETLNAAYIHLHAAAGYNGNSPCLFYTNLDEAKELVRRTLIGGQNSTHIPIGIENLPTPSAGDFDTDPHTVWRDYVESVEDCLDVVRNTNLKVTFDTCHYACGIEEIDLVAGARALGEHLNFLHISDVGGFWDPYESLWTEGLVPGEGRIGDEQFEKFFDYIREEHSDISICIEVSNKDKTNPKQTIDSLVKVRNWLER